MNKETLYRLIEEVIDENRKGWKKYKPKFRDIKRMVNERYPNALLYDEDTGKIIFKKGKETFRTQPIDKEEPAKIALDIEAILQAPTTDADLNEKKKKKKKKKKKDACYRKVKARYKVWPSAYASGALVKCRKVGAKNWGNKSESLDEAEITDDEKEELEDVSKQLKGAVKAHGNQAKAIDKALKKENKKNCGCGQDPCKTYGVLEEEGLKAWFDDADGDGQSGWEQIGGKYDGKPCAKQPGQKTKPKCASPEKAASMSKKERDSAARRKREQDPNPNRKGKAKNVNTDPKKESLYKVIEEVIEEMNNELAEAELEEKKNSKCTKVTKKASSTRKGKKWMKCVKSDSGGYKRIHWGQKGVRVTGKSGNTKRKKSFKARHGCSKAKSNTPKGQACKDWAEE